MFALLRLRARLAARRAAMVSIGAVFCLVGLFFLTLSLWLALAAIMSPVLAGLILAGAYFGIGLIFVGMGSRHYVRVPVDPVAAPAAAAAAATAPPVLGPSLLQAFLYGVQAGARTRRTI